MCYMCEAAKKFESESGLFGVDLTAVAGTLEDLVATLVDAAMIIKKKADQLNGRNHCMLSSMGMARIEYQSYSKQDLDQFEREVGQNATREEKFKDEIKITSINYIRHNPNSD